MNLTAPNASILSWRKILYNRISRPTIVVSHRQDVTQSNVSSDRLQVRDTKNTVTICQWWRTDPDDERANLPSAQTQREIDRDRITRPLIVTDQTNRINGRIVHAEHDTWRIRRRQWMRVNVWQHNHGIAELSTNLHKRWSVRPVVTMLDCQPRG